MEKFKKEAVRGIQGHNQRERKSKSNPDINYDRAGLNYDLHNDSPANYGKIIDQRIDGLNLKKVPRSDAVYMCEVVVSSDAEFFAKLSASDQRPYSPELDPDERLNSDLKGQIKSGLMAGTRDEVKGKIRSAMKIIQKRPERARKYFQDPTIAYAAAA